MNQTTSTSTQTISPLSWGLVFFLALTWGSSYILIKKGLVAYSPQQVASLRISISAIALFPYFLLRYQLIDWSKAKYYAIVGFAGSCIPSFLFAFAQTQINSSITGVLSSLTPLFTLLLGLLFFGIKFSWSKTFAVLVGLSGASFLILFGKEAGLEGNNAYGLLVMLGSILYAISANTIKNNLQNVDVLTLSAVSFFMIGIPALSYLFTTNFIEVLTTHEQGFTSFGYITLLALVGTVIASVLFFKLVQMTNAVFASMVSYLIPLVALLWGAIDQEPITIYHFVGMSLILFGVWLGKRG